ncbi:MAG: outer membrane protein assembly factor BamE, partial [Gammaproteobacteria bacterium]|nr:outer membrane protein assembly factor BamE [Gammaproteobacteria bacterium]
QVRFLLGNPVINDLFHPDRWDYIYYVTPAGETPNLKRLTLYFEGSVLTRVLDQYFEQPDS